MDKKPYVLHNNCMENPHQFPTIVLRGTPKERGLAHGTAARELVVKNIAFYKTLLKLDDETLRTQAQMYAKKIAAFRPEFLEEMDGIAEGAGVESVYIYMLNARTEILSQTDGVHSECATFYFAQTGLLFENWDWSEPSKDMTVLLSITLPNGNNVLTFTEAGILGKIGMSSRGFGVAFNYLFPNRTLDGTPIHALLRALLECDSYDAAHALLSSQEFVGTSGNILLADAHSNATNFELSGSKTTVLPFTGSYIAHTNHYLGDTPNVLEAGEGFLHNTHARYTRAQEMLQSTQEFDIETAKNILGDRVGDGMLCRNFIPEDPGDIPFGTIASIIMDLPGQKMHIATDAPQEARVFKTYSL